MTKDAEMTKPESDDGSDGIIEINEFLRRQRDADSGLQAEQRVSSPPVRLTDRDQREARG